ncbi:MAG: LemA family protein [Acidobacteriota bacterium]
MTSAIVFLVLVVLLVAIVAGIYNRLVKLRNRFKNAFAQIDVQLKRRYDLIPNLVETAKGYIKHERETLEAVVNARNQASAARAGAAASPGDPEAMKGLQGAEASLTGAMGRLMVVVEAYPELKADKQMSQLMEELTSTENKVAFARQSYNDSVMVFNTACETFPNILIAGPMGFRQATLFEIEAPEQREAPKVSF